MYGGTISPCTAPESCVDSNLRFWGISLLWDQREKYEVSVSGCLGYQKFWFHNNILRGSEIYWKSSCIVFLFRGSEILYPLLCCWGIRNSESSPVLFEGQKSWILSCVVWGSEILNPLLCCLVDQKFWILSCVVLGVRNSESSPVLFGDQKFWILSCVVRGSEILNPLLCSWGMRNSESSPVLFGGLLGRILWSFQTGRRFLWVLTPV